MARWFFHVVLAVFALGAGADIAWAADSDRVPAPIEQERPQSPEIEETEVETDALADRGERLPWWGETLSAATLRVPESLVRTPPVRPPRA